MITVRVTNAEEEKRKAICLEQLAQDRQQLLIRWPFIGSIIMRMELIAVRDDRLETACTDGNNIYVDIDFFKTLNKDERLFVLAHEVWHSVFLHFARKKQRDPELFNAACDLEIHFALREEKMRAPWVLPHSESWAGLSAEEIFEKLLNDPRYKNFQHNDNADEFGSNGKSGSFDRHIYDGDNHSANDANAQERAQNAGKSEVVFDSDFAPQIKGDTAERVRGRVVAAVQQIERMQGSIPANIKNLLEKLLQPELPWQELLKQFVTICYGGKRRWLPPSRRQVWQDFYLPSMRSESIKAVVALDTSGSTSADLKQFFSELVSLMNTFGRYDLTVIQCDAAIQKVENFSDSVPLSNRHKWEAAGFGGTDFRPVFEYVNKQLEQPEFLIYFTDGYGNAPQVKPPYPVLWVVTNDGREPAEWGKIIHFKN